jgi:hypothetical protein
MYIISYIFDLWDATCSAPGNFNGASLSNFITLWWVIFVYRSGYSYLNYTTKQEVFHSLYSVGLPVPNFVHILLSIRVSWQVHLIDTKQRKKREPSSTSQILLWIMWPASWSSGQSFWLLIDSRFCYGDFSLKGKIPMATMVWVV